MHLLWGQTPNIVFIFQQIAIQYISEIFSCCHIRMLQTGVKVGFYHHVMLLFVCKLFVANMCRSKRQICPIVSLRSACPSLWRQALWAPWQMFAELGSVGVQGGRLFESFSPAWSDDGRCVWRCSPCSLNGMLQSLQRAWETLRGWKLWGRPACHKSTQLVGVLTHGIPPSMLWTRAGRPFGRSSHRSSSTPGRFAARVMHRA